MNAPTPREQDLDALLGAYALDALDDDERARVEAYIESNDAARREVDELRESAAALALAPVDDLSTPPALWDRISTTIAPQVAEATGPTAGPGDELAARRARRGWSSRWVGLAAAAAAVAVVLLAVQVISLRGDLDDARSPDSSALAARYDRATKVDGARELELVASRGSEVARLVLLPDGSGVMLNDSLADLSPDETYQLWVLMGKAQDPTVISAGVLGPAPQAASFKTEGPVVGFAITIERAGGVTSSENEPLAIGTFA
jgi:anti-sigma-K factor RskA